MSKGILYINAWTEGQTDNYWLDLETFIILHVSQFTESPKLQLKLNILSDKPQWSNLVVSFSNITYELIKDPSDITQICRWPLLVINNQVVSGLCSVARQVCRLSTKDSVRKLLGFREACLVACAESSIWTRFCEVDIIRAINQVLKGECVQDGAFLVPHEIVNFENHLSQPVRIHNIYKLARNKKNEQRLNSSTPREQLMINHDFAEGPYVTLADLILYPCLKLFKTYCDSACIPLKFPLTLAWLQRLDFPNIGYNCPNNTIVVGSTIYPEINNVSLYNADPKRTEPVNHTTQNKIEAALNLVDQIKPCITNTGLLYGFDTAFDWSMVPLKASPHCGTLPANRAQRKCEQLESLAKATLAVVKNKSYKIVDFCSGSGHLGILIACLLPKCHIILVENKERSLARARETIGNLNLVNVTIVQSNLDYFRGSFDLGLALHACGVATDLVLKMCIENKADFVCCPCCYGGIKQCHKVSYPRSEQYKSLFIVKHLYFNLAHAADQTHDLKNVKTRQGYFCMDVIDTDRRLYAMECGYTVHLGKLQPETCTNKNNLLVGICNERP
ncbi:glutathione S-transferase C-terminal domain-containing protein homolog [Anthonomus grandis grandis]|uniref:glutathione S-transferase C-terminal domain-containing protein homolog n=1 Tax=Anthonomus grandis grandis TaxID=2921223 RepID=UPI002165FFA9|nr:glutathione S-transferase C-terminal domain-containing protein homolog [Anthonomus grandis grandis]